MDTTLISDLIRSGVDPDLIARVANAILSAGVRGQSADSADSRRLSDRLRQRRKRAKLRESKGKAEANDAATIPILSAKTSADSADNRDNCAVNLLSSLTESPSGIRKKRKKESTSEPRAGSCRIDEGRSITQQDFNFAAAAGIPVSEIPGRWAEFVDYWVGVPGGRGVKNNWSATWRNRIRSIIEYRGKNGSHNGSNKRNFADLHLELQRKLADEERTVDLREDEFSFGPDR